MISYNIFIKKTSLRAFSLALLFSLFIFASCGKKEGASGVSIPNDFNTLSVEQKIDYLAENESPEKVAQFIINAALGKEEGVSLDLRNATVYAYSHYKEADRKKFAEDYDKIVSSLPTPEKMKLYYAGGQINTFELGCHLGRDYIKSVRDNSSNAGAVKEEITEFEKACNGDSATYQKFVAGLFFAAEEAGDSSLFSYLRSGTPLPPDSLNSK